MKVNYLLGNMTNLAFSYQRPVVEVVGLQGSLMHVLVFKQIETLQAADLKKKTNPFD